MSDASRDEYLARVHRAQDYIERHLAEPLTLEDIARQGCFSPFHFHRVFSAVVGETLYQFISRVRLERAVSLLLNQPKRSITDIALDTGHSGSATFARAFQTRFGLSASAFRKRCLKESKNREVCANAASYLLVDLALKPVFKGVPMNVVTPKAPTSLELRTLPAKNLAYLRHVGPYAGDAALFGRLWGELGQWAGPRGLFGAPGAELICIYHDDPEITEQAKLRLSLGITVPPSMAIDPPMGLLAIPEGLYACARFELDATEYGAAWAYVMGEWLPSSGYQPSDAPIYECYLNDPATHPEGKHIVEIRLGVKAL